MLKIKTREFLDKVEAGEITSLVLRGFSEGEFYLMGYGDDDFVLHVNLDGSPKRYKQLELVLDWLKRKTGLTQIVVDFGGWNCPRKGIIEP